MRWSPLRPLAFLAALAALSPGRSGAQVTLSDDIILATQGKENAEKARKSSLGRSPGTQASPYRRSPGSGDVILGQDPNRRLAPLRRPAPRPANPPELDIPAPMADRVGPRPLPESGYDGRVTSAEDLEDEGPPGGLTLDDAIDRLVHRNPDLLSKSLEIPQAEADILTAGLRENPLVFYSSDSVPYGSYGPKSPGDINHGLSLVVPLDYSGKRRARIALSRREKCVLEAQYRNAIRLAIDDLYSAFVDALSARLARLWAGRTLVRLDQLLEEAWSRPGRTERDEEALDDLTIERELAAISAADELVRYGRARQRLAVLLDLSPEEAGRLEPRGSLRTTGAPAPPFETLASIALGRRPDLAAFRLGTARALAELDQERAERMSDVYLLYTPFEYRDNSQVGLASNVSWGAGIFASIPLFNRNQGNVQRARLNVEQSRREAAAIEAQVFAEVRQVYLEYQATAEDVARFERAALPASRRKLDRALRRSQAGGIDDGGLAEARREAATLARYHRETLARHRRDALRINTVVGHRVLP